MARRRLGCQLTAEGLERWLLHRELNHVCGAAGQMRGPDSLPD